MWRTHEIWGARWRDALQAVQYLEHISVDHYASILTFTLLLLD